jgi:hypothetical protein
LENILKKIWEEENGQPYKVINNRLTDLRTLLAEKYSWGIPNNQALNEIGKYSPLVEVGAGLGYWARLLQDRGIRIRPTDINIPLCTERWTKVYSSSAAQTLQNETRSLFLCWIPEKIAQQAAEVYQGKYILWVGEKINFPNFKLIKEITIPTWNGFKDSLQIFLKI